MAVELNPPPKEEDLASLNAAMTRLYNSNRIATRRGTIFHSGEIVAVRLECENNGWFRARVIEESENPDGTQFSDGFILAISSEAKVLCTYY